jgi:hypothetical protein
MPFPGRAGIKCVIMLIVFMIFSVGSIPMTCTIGLLVVIFCPAGLKKLVDTIYADENDLLFNTLL